MTYPTKLLKSWSNTKKDQKNTKKKLIVFLIIFFIILTIFSKILQNYPKLNPFNDCPIVYNEALLGNTNTIKYAINHLKMYDYESYKNVCTYVNRITEGHCVGLVVDDINSLRYPAYNNSIMPAELPIPGCYIKGSKEIVLRVDYSTSEIKINERAELIKKLANFSKIFWNQ